MMGSPVLMRFGGSKAGGAPGELLHAAFRADVRKVTF
jgi:hypothetical protein